MSASIAGHLRDRIRPVASAVVVAAALTGCPCTPTPPGPAPTPLSTLAPDPFEVPPGEAYPRPVEISSDLRSRLTAVYGSDPDVRRALARRFLEYDAVLLSRGLITADAGPETAIGLLYELESVRNRSFLETPSAWAMREHIGANESWFALGSDERTMLAANRAAFDALAQSWRNP